MDNALLEWQTEMGIYGVHMEDLCLLPKSSNKKHHDYLLWAYNAAKRLMQHYLILCSLQPHEGAASSCRWGCWALQRLNNFPSPYK